MTDSKNILVWTTTQKFCDLPKKYSWEIAIKNRFGPNHSKSHVIYHACPTFMGFVEETGPNILSQICICKSITFGIKNLPLFSSLNLWNELHKCMLLYILITVKNKVIEKKKGKYWTCGRS